MYLRHVDSKKNESLLSSLRNLQKSQNHENKLSPNMSKSKNNKFENSSKGIEQKSMQPLCPFTKKKYIKDIYVKNIVPDIINTTKKARRQRKLAKIRRLNKSQIKVKQQCVKRVNMNYSTILSQAKECL